MWLIILAFVGWLSIYQPEALDNFTSSIAEDTEVLRSDLERERDIDPYAGTTLSRKYKENQARAYGYEPGEPYIGISKNFEERASEAHRLFYEYLDSLPNHPDK